MKIILLLLFKYILINSNLYILNPSDIIIKYINNINYVNKLIYLVYLYYP